jgi:2-oxoglutarate ferredoxin oxidoreductase subunit beta
MESDLKVVFDRPRSLTDEPFSYCPGCTHGIVHRLVAEVIDELDVRERAIGICPVGCSVFAYQNWDCDMIQASHGRAPAVGTGVKRSLPDRVVFTYQGDGDLIAIGTAETVHAATRGENITVIFINNAVYGMTRGQIAPTTIPGQRTTTCPEGRRPALEGNPIRVCELLSALDGPGYIARVSVSRPRYVRQARRAMLKAFQCQLDGRGFSLVEVLSSCPSCWGMTPLDALTWLEQNMIPYYPLGEFVGGDGETSRE